MNTYGKVVHVLPGGVICKLCKNKEKKTEEEDILSFN